jgi:TRAP-type transport system periplasmic protein
MTFRTLARGLATLVMLAGLVVSTSVVTHAADWVIRFTHGSPETMELDQHAYAVVFKEKLEAESDGRIEVRILGANQGGDERQQLERVQAGINQMANVSQGTQHQFFPDAQIWSIPFLFSSNAVAWEVLDGQFGQKYNDAFREATGVRILNHTESGFRSIFNSVREIRTPADMVGLRFRTRENPVEMEMFRALGANPTPISWTEVYTALQQGVVDGMENPPGLFYQMKFFEQQRYMTTSRHQYGLHTTIMNEDFFQSLPDDLKDLVMVAAREALTISRTASYMQSRAAFANLVSEGIQIYQPNAEEFQQFRDLGRPPVEKFVRDEIGDEWVDDLLAAIEDAERRLSYAGQ